MRGIASKGFANPPGARPVSVRGHTGREGRPSDAAGIGLVAPRRQTCADAAGRLGFLARLTSKGRRNGY